MSMRSHHESAEPSARVSGLPAGPGRDGSCWLRGVICREGAARKTVTCLAGAGRWPARSPACTKSMRPQPSPMPKTRKRPAGPNTLPASTEASTAAGTGRGCCGG